LFAVFLSPGFDVSPTNNTGSDPQQTFSGRQPYQPLPIRAANVAQAPFTLYLPDIAIAGKGAFEN